MSARNCRRGRAKGWRGPSPLILALALGAVIAGAPAHAASSPQLAPISSASGSIDRSVASFYAARGGSPLWLSEGNRAAASQLIGILQRASLDGLDSGPALATEAQALIARGQGGDRSALVAADRLLSTAWVLYMQAIQASPPGMTYADPWVVPRREAPEQVLMRAASAPSLISHVRKVAQVNPLYAELRDAAWAQMQSNGRPDPRILTSLQRVRDMPFQHRYLIVDSAAARLYMIEDGRIADSMKVIVGKPSTQTPMLASTIYYATLNPYWHVDGDLVRSLIAKNVLDQGLGYLKSHGYQVMPAEKDDDRLLDPAKVDWRAVADGSQQVRVRQLPGPGNSMGRIKFGFPNPADIYLHDTPNKDLFAQDDRDLSHGCIRLEDAERLGQWLLGREPQAASNQPEENVLLPSPVPIYITYLTAQVRDGQLGFVDDIYGHDLRAFGQIAAR